MRIRVVRGVTFDARVRSASPKQVVVNDAFVHVHFAGSNPLGEPVLMPWDDTLR